MSYSDDELEVKDPEIGEGDVELDLEDGLLDDGPLDDDLLAEEELDDEEETDDFADLNGDEY